MTILIIDNEGEVRTTIRAMIQSWNPALYRVEEADGVGSGLTAIQQLQPDIVLLDIEMNDGTGFDLLRQLPRPGFRLIFITAFDQYAIQAFRFSAIDYLLKPVDPLQLREALQKAVDMIDNRNLEKQLSVLLQQLSTRPGSAGQIVLKDVEKTYFIQVQDIIYCQAEGSYTRFYLVNNESVFVSRNLRSYEELLSPSGFIRTHHSCLVNPARIRVFDRKTDGGLLHLDGGHRVPVSQRKKDFVLQLLESR